MKSSETPIFGKIVMVNTKNGESELVDLSKPIPHAELRMSPATSAGVDKLREYQEIRDDFVGDTMQVRLEPVRLEKNMIFTKSEMVEDEEARQCATATQAYIKMVEQDLRKTLERWFILLKKGALPCDDRIWTYLGNAIDRVISEIRGFIIDSANIKVGESDTLTATVPLGEYMKLCQGEGIVIAWISIPSFRIKIKGEKTRTGCVRGVEGAIIINCEQSWKLFKKCQLIRNCVRRIYKKIIELRRSETNAV